MSDSPDDTDAWVEFDPEPRRPQCGAVLLWHVGRDAQGSPLMHTDPDRFKSVALTTTDRAEAYKALGILEHRDYDR
jgi:hypothetical protein